MKQKRWTSEEGIIKRIDYCRNRQRDLFTLSENQKFEAKQLIIKAEAELDGLDARGYRIGAEELLALSKKNLKTACRYDTTSERLARILAAFRTQLLPIDGNTDLAVV